MKKILFSLLTLITLTSNVGHAADFVRKTFNWIESFSLDLVDDELDNWPITESSKPNGEKILFLTFNCNRYCNDYHNGIYGNFESVPDQGMMLSNEAKNRILSNEYSTIWIRCTPQPYPFHIGHALAMIGKEISKLSNLHTIHLSWEYSTKHTYLMLSDDLSQGYEVWPDKERFILDAKDDIERTLLTTITKPLEIIFTNDGFPRSIDRFFLNPSSNIKKAK